MSVVLRVVPQKSGNATLRKLKKGRNDLDLPRGAHIEVTDEHGAQLLRPVHARHESGQLILDYKDGNGVVSVHVRGEQVDQASGQGVIDLGAVYAALDEGAGISADAATALDAGQSDAGQSDGGAGDHGHHSSTGLLLLLLGLGGLGGIGAAVAGGGSKSAPAAPPSAPVVTLESGITNGANADKATSASGIVTVNAASGSSVDITFTNGSHSVVKTVSGTGAAVAVVLTPADLQALGDGAIAVSAVAKANGASSTPATASFTLDTLAPAAPTLSLASDTGSSATDHVTSNASVTVAAENGSAVALTFTNSSNGHTLTKSVTGTGAAQSVSLTGVEAASLGDGAISVSAVATDAAGNASTAGALSYTLDTATAVAISSQPILVGGTPVITGTGEAGAVVALTVAGATYHTTVGGNGQWAVNLASATPDSGTLALNTNGINAVGVTETDIAGNTATASQSLQLVTADSGVVTTSATNVTVQVNAVNTGVPVQINAPNATAITLTGTIDGNAVEINVNDPTPGVANSRTIEVVSSVTPATNPANPNLLIFNFADALDRVVLDPSSSVQGFNQIEVRNGTVDLSGVNITGIVNIQINSGVVLTLPQFEALSSMVSLSGLGQLTIHLDTAAQVNDLISFLGSPGQLFLMGINLTVEYGASNTIISNGTVSTLLTGLDYPSIPQIVAAITALQSAESGNTASIAQLISDASTHNGTATIASIAGIDAALTALQNQVAQQQLDLNAIQAHNLDTLETLVNNLSGALSTLTTQVSAQATQIAGNSADITTQAQQITALLSSVGALQASVASLETTSNTTASALATLETAHNNLAATVTALSNTLTADIAALQGTDFAHATYQDISSLSAEVVSLDAALAALSHVVSSNDTAQTAALNAAVATLNGTITTLANTVAADVAALQGTNWATATYQDIASLSAQAVALNTALTTLQGDSSVTGSVAQQIAASATTLNAAISALAAQEQSDVTNLQNQIGDLQNQLGSVWENTFSQIMSLHDQVSQQINALQALIGFSSVSDQINSAVSALDAQFSTLINALHGSGLPISVNDTLTLLASDPYQLLTNYRLTDTYANLFAAAQLAGDANAFAYAKSVVINDPNTALSAGDITALVAAVAGISHAAPLDFAHSDYSLSDTTALLAGLTAAELNGATTITATGAATIEQVRTLLLATNSDTTTIDTVTGTASQILSLPITSHDSITTITVTGIATAQQALDLYGLEASGDATTVNLGSVVDTAANIEAAIATYGDASFLASATGITVNGTVSVAEAEQLQAANSHVHFTSIADNVTSLITGYANGTGLLGLGSVDALTATGIASIADAHVLQQALPGHVTIADMVDTSADFGAALQAGTLSLSGVSALSITDASVADYATAAQGVLLSHSSLGIAYDVADTSAHFAAAIAANGQSFLSNAGNIELTGTASIAVARSLLGAHNSGTVTIDNLYATAAQVSSLSFDAHDVVTSLTVTPSLYGDQTVDLTNVPFGTNLTYNGGSVGTSGTAYAQTIYLPVPDGVAVVNGVDQAGQVTLHGGAGDNRFVFTDDASDGTAIDTAYAVGSSIDYATNNGSHGTETLVLIGTVDISNIALNGADNSYDLTALMGSPSSVTLSAQQLNKLHNFNGASGGTVINITDAPDPVTGTVAVTTLSNNALTTHINFSNVTGVNIGVNDNLQIDWLALLGLQNVHTSDAGNNAQQSGLVTPLFDPSGPTYLTTNGQQNGPAVSPSWLANSTFNVDLSAAHGLSLGQSNGTYYLVDGAGNHLNLPAMLNGTTLGLSADELTGSGAPLQIAASNGGVLDLHGLVNSSGHVVDVTQISAPIDLAITQNTDLTGVSGADATQLAADLAHILADSGQITVNNATLTLTPNEANTLPVSGSGTVVVSGTATQNEDFSNLTATTVDLSGVVANGHTITVPATVPSSHTLILSQDEANGATITGQGSVHVVLGGSGPLDVSHIATSSIALEVPAGASATVPSGSNLHGLPILVDATGTLTIDGDMASGTAITGAGHVVVTGTGTVNGGDDFSTLHATTVDLSQYSGPIAHLPTLATNGVQHLILSEAEANYISSAAGNHLTVPSGTDVTVLGNGPASASGAALDLSGLVLTGTGSASLHVTSDTVLDTANLGHATVSVDTGTNFTLPVGAADGVAMTGLGAVHLTGGGAVSADLTAIAASSVSWEVPVDTTFTGQLGTTQVTIDHDVALTSAIGKFDGATVLAGAANFGHGEAYGVLKLTGTLATQDLSGVAVSLDLSHANGATDSVNPASITGLTLPTFVAHQALIATYAEAANVTLDAGAGDVRIVTISSNPAASLSGITTDTGTVTEVIDGNATFTGTFSTGGMGSALVHFVTGANDAAYTLSLDGVKLDGLAVDGTGTVNVTTVSASSDLSDVLSSVLDFSHDANLAVVAHALQDGSAVVTLPQLTADHTLVLTAVEASTLNVAGTGGTVDVVGDMAASTDLTGVGAGIAISFADALDPQAGAQVSVSASAVLTMDGDQLTGQTILGEGALVVLGRNAGELTSAVDLSGVGIATLDLTQISDLVVTGTALTDLTTTSYAITLPTLAADQTLYVNSEQLTGGAVTLDGTGTLQINHDITVGSVNLSNIGDGVTFHPDGSNGFGQIDVASNLALTIKAIHANGEVITGQGAVAIVDDTTHTASLVIDLTHISADFIDLTRFSGLHVDANGNAGHLIDASGTVVLDLPVIGSGQELQLSLSELNSTEPLILSGTGSVKLDGYLDGVTYNLTGMAETLTVYPYGGTYHLTNGGTLIATAGQISGATIEADDASADTLVLADVSVARTVDAAAVAASLATNASAPIMNDIADTAAHLAALNWASGLAYLLHGTVVATTPATLDDMGSLMNANYLRTGLVTFSVMDTAANFANAPVYGAGDGLVIRSVLQASQNGGTVTVSDPVGVSDAAQLVADNLLFKANNLANVDNQAWIGITFTVADTAADLLTQTAQQKADLANAIAFGHGAITVAGTATAAQASALHTAFGSEATYTLSDTAADLLAQHGTDGNWAFLTHATSAEVTGAVSAADAATLEAAAGSVALTIDTLSDSASALATAIAGHAGLLDDVAGITFSGAIAVGALGSHANASVGVVSDTADNLTALGYAKLASNAVISSTTEATAAQASAIVWNYYTAHNQVGAATEHNSLFVNISDTAANIIGMNPSQNPGIDAAAVLARVTGTVHVSDAATAQEAVELAWISSTSSARVLFSVADTAANLAAELTGNVAVAVTGSVTATTAATAAQAQALYAIAHANGVSANFAVTISDTAANIATALGNSSAFLALASSITVTDTVTVQEASAILAAAANGASVSFASLADQAATVDDPNNAYVLTHVAGAVVATGTATETNLSHVSSSIDLRGVATLGVQYDAAQSANAIVINPVSTNANGITTRTPYDVVLPTLIAGQTLFVDAAEMAGGLAAAIAGAGTLVVAGDIAGNTDLTGVGSGVSVSFKDGVESGTYGTVAIADGAALTALDSQITLHTITGAGTLVVHGGGANGHLAGTLDLSGVTANIDLTAPALSVSSAQGHVGQLVDSGHYVDLPALTGQTISLTVAELTDHIALAGTGTLDLQGDITASLDLTYLPTSISLSFLDSGDANGLSTVNIASGATLTATASELTDQVITGTDATSTVDVAYAQGSANNLSASSDFAHVFSTDYTTATAWASALQAANSALSSQIAVAHDAVVLSGSNSNATGERFTFTASAAGTYTFTLDFQNNYHGARVGQSAFGTYADGGLPAGGSNDYRSNQYNTYDNGWVPTYDDSYRISTNVNGGQNQDSGALIASGTTTYTVTLVAGETLAIDLYAGAGRTAGPDGSLTSASTLTLTNGGFSTVGGTASQLNVDVGQTTDLTGSADPLAYVPVDSFTLYNDAVLTLTGAEANSHSITNANTSNGYVQIAGDITTGWVDVTGISTGLQFLNSQSDNNPLNITYDNWLRLTAAQANGLYISGGTVDIAGDMADGGNIFADLTHIQANTLSFEDSNNADRSLTSAADLTTATITRNEFNTLQNTGGWWYGQLYVGATDTLVLRTDQASYHSISGPGTTYVIGDVGAGQDLFLLGITSNLSFWDGINGGWSLGANGEEAQGTNGKGSITLDGNATIEVQGNQLNGNAILGDGSNEVRVYGLLGSSSTTIDLSNITTSLDFAYAYDNPVWLASSINANTQVVTYENSNGTLTVGFNSTTGGVQTYIANSVSGYYNTLSALLPQHWNDDQTVTLYSLDANDLSLDTRNYSNGNLVRETNESGYTYNSGAKVIIAHVEDLLSNGVINGDFSQINAQLVTVNFGSHQGNVLNYTGSFGASTVLIDDGVNVVMDGAIASGVTFDTQHDYTYFYGNYSAGSGFGVLGIDTLTGNADLTNTVNNPASFNLTLPSVYGHVDIDLSYGAVGSSYLPNNAAAITWDPTQGLFTNGTYTITLPTFDGLNALIVNANQLAGGVNFNLNGAGELGVEGAIAANLDLSGLNSNFGVYFASNTTDIRQLAHRQFYNWPNGGDAWSAVSGTSVDLGVALSLRPDQIYNHINISGPGTLALTSGEWAANIGFGNVDLISVSANIDITGLGANPDLGGVEQASYAGTTVFWEGNSLITYTSGYQFGNGFYDLLLPRLANGQTLRVLSSQLVGANGVNIDGQLGSALDIVGNITDTVVLTNVQAAVGIHLDNGTAQVTSNGELYARADQLNGLTLTGAGTVYASTTGFVSGKSAADTSALQQTATSTTDDLSGISANLDLTGLSAHNGFTGIEVLNGVFVDSADTSKTITLPDLIAGQTVTATALEVAGQLALHQAAQNGGGTLDITGDLTALTGSVDLTHVQDGIAISFADAVNADVAISGASTSLTIKGGQVSGLTITGDGTSALAFNNHATADRYSGSAVVVADDDTGHLSGSVDLTHVSANVDLSTLTALTVDSNGVLTDGSGSLSLATSGEALLGQQTLFVEAGQLASAGNGLTGRVILHGQTGSVVDAKGDIGAGKSVDLTGIISSTISFRDSADTLLNDITVSGALTVLAEQFDEADSMKIDGTGALTLNATQATTTVNWVDSAQTPGYYIAETLNSLLDVQDSTTLVAAGAGAMPVAMQIKVEDAKVLHSGFGWVDGRTIYDPAHAYSLSDASTGVYAETGGKLVVTGTATGTLDLSHVSVGTLDLTGYTGTSFTGLWSDLTNHALILNDTQADGNSFYASGNGGALSVDLTAPTAYHDFGGIDTSVNSTLEVASAGLNMANAISNGDYTRIDVFTHVDLAFTGSLTVSANQDNGITADHFIGTGGLTVLDDGATHHGGTEVLFGTANNDTFVGGGYGDDIHLSGAINGTGNGGTDTISFSTLAGTQGHTLDFNVYDFTTGSGAGADILDFSSLSSHSASHTAGVGSVGSISLAHIPAALGQEVIAVTDSFAADASGVASVFGFGNNLLNSALVAAGNTDAIFLVALSDPNNSGNGQPAVNFAVWHWQEAQSGNGYVHANELSEIGVLHNLTSTQVTALSSGNVIG